MPEVITVNGSESVTTKSGKWIPTAANRRLPLKFYPPASTNAYNSASTEHVPLTLKSSTHHPRSNHQQSHTVGIDMPSIKVTEADGRKVSAPTLELEHRWQGVWHQLDRQRTGRVSTHQLLDHMANNDESKFVPLEMREKMIRFADRNKDGYIDFEEFLALVKAGDASMELDKYRRIIALAAYLNVPKTERPFVVDNYYSHYDCYPPPIFMIVISLLQIIVFCYYAIVLGGVTYSGPVPAGSPLIYNPYRRYEAWRYFIYMFLHVGWFHLLVNIFVQLVVGVPLELVHKFWRLGIIYVLGILAGSLGASFTDPSVFLAGASGGVYALMAAHLANLILNWNELEVPSIRLAFWLSLFSIDAGVAVYARYGPANPITTKVSYAAHFFGALVGILIGVVVLRNLLQLRWELKVWWVCIGFVVLLFGFFIVWNFLATSFPAPDCSPLVWPGGKTFVKNYCV